MKKLTMTQLTNEEGIRVFYTNSSRINITDLPKDKLGEAKRKLQNNFKTPGVYILFGEDIEKGFPVAYIGEADDLANRINSHLKEKAWIERIVMITSQLSLQEFSKTELHYIEKQLIRDFGMNTDYVLMNGNAGQGRRPEPLLEIELKEDISLIEEGLEIMGYKFDNSTSSVQEALILSGTDERLDIKVYAKIPKHQGEVNAILKSDDSVTILKGERFASSAMHKSSDNIAEVLRMLRRLIRAEQIVNHGDEENYDIEFIEDVRFNKPSMAGILVCAGANNGWFLWKDRSNDQHIDYLRK